MVSVSSIRDDVMSDAQNRHRDLHLVWLLAVDTLTNITRVYVYSSCTYLFSLSAEEVVVNQVPVKANQLCSQNAGGQALVDGNRGSSAHD